MRRRIFKFATLLSLVLCVITVGALVMSFIKPLGMSKDWVIDFRNGSSTYRNGLYWGAAGQGERFIFLSRGVIYDRSFEFGNPYVDRSTLVLHEHMWHSDTSGRLLKTTLGFSWEEMYWQSAGYSYERQVSVPLLFIALVTGMFPAVKSMFPRRRLGCCAKCGYDLTGNSSGVCPECGMAVAKGTTIDSAPGRD